MVTTAGSLALIHISGVDGSSYQGVVDWPAVKAAGADFAMLRGNVNVELNFTYFV